MRALPGTGIGGGGGSRLRGWRKDAGATSPARSLGVMAPFLLAVPTLAPEPPGQPVVNCDLQVPARLPAPPPWVGLVLALLLSVAGISWGPALGSSVPSVLVEGPRTAHLVPSEPIQEHWPASCQCLPELGAGVLLTPSQAV